MSDRMETNTPIATSSYLNADHLNATIPSSTGDNQANYHNAPTNVKMTLADARTELESHGFVIMDQSQELLSTHLLVGCLSECRWQSLMKVDTLVIVQELMQTTDSPLTLGRIQEDLKKLKTDWLFSLPPPFIPHVGAHLMEFSVVA
jgi:hypothetical protein